MLTLKQKLILEVLCWLLLVVIIEAVAGPIALVILIVGIIFFASVYFRYLARRRLFKKVESAINDHMHALIRRKTELVQFEGRGVPNFEPWWREIGVFVTNDVEPFLTRGERAALKSEDVDIIAFVDRRVTAGTWVQRRDSNG